MEIKPIFVIRLPFSEKQKESYLSWIETIRYNLKDFQILAVMDNKTERVEFECYNVKNYNETEFNELKEKLSKSFNDIS